MLYLRQSNLMEILCPLRNPNTQDSTTIHLIVNHNNRRYKVSSGLKVKPKFWNRKTYTFREQMDFPEGKELNNRLREMKTIMRSILVKSPRIGPRKFRSQFRKALQEGGNTAVKTKFWKHYDDFVSDKKEKVSHDVYKDYNNSLRKHLKACEATWGKRLKIEDLKNSSGSFVDILSRYLTLEATNSKGHKGLAVNTIGKQYKNIKVFLNWCFDRDIVPPFSLKHLVTITEESFNVFLNKEELDRLEHMKLETKEEKDARDFFLICCETGMRFNECNALDPHQFDGKKLVFIRSKAINKTIIPVPEGNRLSRLFRKRINNLPKFKSTSVLNPLLQQLCKKAGIDDIIEVPRRVKNKVEIEKHNKYALVSSHTGRRSFCTNMFMKGTPAHVIMKFSGHKTEKSFLRYLKLDAEMTAELSAQYFEE
jgi:integrase